MRSQNRGMTPSHKPLSSFARSFALSAYLGQHLLDKADKVRHSKWLCQERATALRRIELRLIAGYQDDAAVRGSLSEAEAVEPAR